MDLAMLVEDRPLSPALSLRCMVHELAETDGAVAVRLLYEPWQAVNIVCFDHR